MKVGLVRHFKVKTSIPKKILITQNELFNWLDQYDKAEIFTNKVDLTIKNIKWGKCYVSDLPRAEKTAKIIYGTNTVLMKDLRELQTERVFKKNIRLPFIIWALLVRLKFLLSSKAKNEYRKNISLTLDKILGTDDDILIVSHGFIMIYIRKELVRRGFRGPGYIHPKNGKLYLFESSLSK